MTDHHPTDDSPGNAAGAIVSSCKMSARQGDTKMLRDPAIPRLVSVAGAAELLGRSRQWVNTLINDGRLPAAHAGDTLVLAEATVRRYAAGERFAFPASLAIFVEDADTDGWALVEERHVPPDYELPERMSRAEIDVPEEVYRQVGARSWFTHRVELRDNEGRTIGLLIVEGKGE